MRNFFQFVTFLWPWFFLTILSAEKIHDGTDDSLVQEIDSSYFKGLEYLASSQGDKGMWNESSYGNQPGVLGMAILAFISRGDDPEFGPYADAVKKALNALLSQQDEKTGFIGKTMYNHGFACLALAELYGMLNDDRIGLSLKKAVSLIVAAAKSNPKNAWRYYPDSKDFDTTVSGTQIVALFAARNAGLSVPNETIEKALEVMISCQDSRGGFGYSTSSGANLPRTSIGSLVLSLAQKTDTESYSKSLEYLQRNAKYGDQGHKFYSLYYTAQAMFRANPEMWTQWNERNVKVLLETQQGDGSWRGNHGTVFSTCSALLSMALNYRYLPIYER